MRRCVVDEPSSCSDYFAVLQVYVWEEDAPDSSFVMHDWDPVLDILAEGSRAIAPALPLFDLALSRVSVEGVAEWVLSFLDALGLEQVALGGNSLGGHVALAAALAAPERVSALILSGSSGLFERSFTRGMKQGFTRGVPHRPSAAFIREKKEEIFFDPALVTPEAVEAVRGSVEIAFPVLERALQAEILEIQLADLVKRGVSSSPMAVVGGGRPRRPRCGHRSGCTRSSRAAVDPE